MEPFRALHLAFDSPYGVGLNYAPALAALHTQGAVWTYAGLDAFLTSPQIVVPGTMMPFGGIADATDRANPIAYLRTRATELAPSLTSRLDFCTEGESPSDIAIVRPVAGRLGHVSGVFDLRSEQARSC